MNSSKDDIAKASKQIGLTNVQAVSLWEALQEIQRDKPKFNLSSVLIHMGSWIAFLSMTYFYAAHLESGYAFFISMSYASVFFATGFYLWYIKNLRIPGGMISALG